MSFWNQISLPIIGMAPMDGITDPAFRATLDVIGKPTIMYTEFVSADGLCRNQKLLRTFSSHNSKTPLIGQLFGSDPGAMAEATSILLEKTGVVGIDINMGCPNRRIAAHGGGAALIRRPTVATNILKRVHDILRTSKRPIGLSVKTRIGYDSITTEEWIGTLLTTPVDAIALHGRTLKEQYTGSAHWGEIKKAALLAKRQDRILLGNGDILSLPEAKERIVNASPDGVLIGRVALGNPWIFQGITPTTHERIQAAILHIRNFLELSSHANPLSLRKHLAWYTKGFPNAANLRSKIMCITTPKEALALFTPLSHDPA